MSALLQQRSTGAARDDARLRDRLVFGDETAFIDLYERFSSLVYTIAARVTRDRRAAEDVTQEVFLAVWQRPLAFDPAKGSLRGWVAMMAHRRAVDLVRREEAHRRTTLDGRLHAEPLGHGDPVGDQVSDADAAERLGTALRALPEHLSRAVTLAYLEGRTYREVAVELGVPEGTAKSRLREGLRRLAVALQSIHAQDGEGP
ncbi:sigma-70 family RNA polymerase sigma factor [Jidongwangia harbinensis]|uniref:sigma-70 family RNA polymerase sigma factor n=1 Tax=Jidongwangia harbinensis TaxID=2878561 RepID=UPI001CDA260D|nr:sigma-70 family RNA polymerase sigma factor [Jidongwangia harbinensis]MCA2211276.1 sigma-70 family RNA polymerase sigma factor [Jidongwangia harbinensis]